VDAVDAVSVDDSELVAELAALAAPSDVALAAEEEREDRLSVL